MGFDLDVTIPALTVFIQGILSFLSPCILPIIPIYMGYLSGGAVTTNEDGKQIYNQKKVIFHTLFFILGVSFAFFLLGLGFSTAGRFFTQNQMLFSRIGGILVIFLGCIQLGIFNKPFKGKEFKLPLKINALNMNPLTALIMGFVFSFAWTPCVGPALSTVLIMISSANSTTTGLILMAVYTLGFTIPFLFVGIFTTQCLNFFRKHSAVVSYTVKIGGALMILMGLMMFTGIMNSITGYLSRFDGVVPNANNAPTQEEEIESTDIEETIEETVETEETPQSDVIPALDFELQDQFGNTHTLADYEGKVIFLNFWATWCPPCREEMPDIQALYENYGYNEEDVIILGLASPASEENAFTQEQDTEAVIQFLADNNYSYPTLLDSSGKLAASYGISAYPTTFMIDVDGNVFGYLPGMMTYDIMESIITQTQESTN